MHAVHLILIVLGALTVLAWALIRVLYDLLERGPYDAPLVEESCPPPDRARWPAEREAGGSSVR